MQRVFVLGRTGVGPVACVSLSISLCMGFMPRGVCVMCVSHALVFGGGSRVYLQEPMKYGTSEDDAASAVSHVA